MSGRIGLAGGGYTADTAVAAAQCPDYDDGAVIVSAPPATSQPPPTASSRGHSLLTMDPRHSVLRLFITMIQ